MKKGNLAAYIFSLIGLFIALYFVAFGTGYAVGYLYAYSTGQYDETAVLRIAGVVYSVLYGLIFYFSHRALCRLLETKRQVTIAFVIVLVLDGIFVSVTSITGGLFAAVNILVLAQPLWERKSQIKANLFKQSPCVCSFCGHINDPDADFCTECGSGLMHEEIEISSGGETKCLFINSIKTIGIIALYFILWWITNHLGNIIAGLFTHAINVDTVLGSIIMLIIYITVETNAFFWLSVVISTLIPSKRSAVCILIAVIIIHCLQITQIWSHWALIVLFLVNLIADIIPVTLQAISSHNKKSPGD